jgi:very-short-patch-repair endonuclease
MSPGQLRNARSTGFFETQELPPGRTQLVVLGGSLVFLDVVFRGVKLAVELDGRLYHSGSEVFVTDRWRQNLSVIDGWCVLRFTSAMIDERPAEVMAMVCEALQMLGAA